MSRSEGTPSASGLLTYPEAAAHLGIAVSTLRHYVTQGRLSVACRATRAGRSVALIAVDDLERVRGLRQRHRQRQEDIRRAIIAAGERACTVCGRSLPLEAFPVDALGIGGRDSRCKRCQCERVQEYNRRTVAARTEYARIWRRENRERWLATRRAYGRRVTAERSARWGRIRAYMSERRLVLLALRDGMASPICRNTGFALVRVADPALRAGWRYRAARLDRPLERGERGIVHYHYLPGEDRWECVAPPFGAANKADDRLRSRLLPPDCRQGKGYAEARSATARLSKRGKEATI